MSVFHLGKHFSEDIKQFILVHRVFNKQIIAVIHIVPVHILEGKEAVILVHDTPKRLEIITRRRVIFCRFLATEEKEKTEEKEERLHKS